MVQANTGSPVVVGMKSADSDLQHLLAGVRDALTDDMVVRLSEIMATGIDLLDKFSRSGLERTLPAITRLVENGDLERVVDTLRLFGAATDSLNEDMVSRLAETGTGILLLIDRLSRNESLMQCVSLLEREDLLPRLLTIIDSACKAGEEMAQTPPTGGARNLWRLATSSETQQALRFLVLFSQNLRAR